MFHALDQLTPGGERGYLTIATISPIYSTSRHPAVVAGKKSKDDVLQASKHDSAHGANGTVVGTRYSWVGQLVVLGAVVGRRGSCGVVVVSGMAAPLLPSTAMSSPVIAYSPLIAVVAPLFHFSLLRQHSYFLSLGTWLFDDHYCASQRPF